MTSDNIDHTQDTDLPPANGSPNRPGREEGNATPETSPELAELSFEEAFNRLGETVQALESGGLTLDAATDLYEKGMSLVRVCNRLLSNAELKVTQLNDAYSSYLAYPEQDEAQEE